MGKSSGHLSRNGIGPRGVSKVGLDGAVVGLDVVGLRARETSTSLRLASSAVTHYQVTPLTRRYALS